MATTSFTEAKTGLEVVPFRREYEQDFAALNQAWVEEYFWLEDNDLKYFNEPYSTIIEPGGTIFFVVEDGLVKGTCALIKHDAGVFELAKMAVTPLAQGRGIGALLMEAAIAHARKEQAQRLFLRSNTRLESAIRLYERFGFVTTHLGPHPSYERVNIEMEFNLNV